MKQKKVTVHYKIEGLYEAQIPADSLEEGLQKAKQMSKSQLDEAPRRRTG